MKQSRIDSAIEASLNILVGTVIYVIVNYTLLSWMLGIHISVATSLWISIMFTIISLIRSYVIRRLCDGKSIWEAIKARFLPDS